MSSVPRRPGLQQAALVAYDAASGQTQSIVFPINPESITRRILAATSGQSASGPQQARERISFVLAVDAQLDDRVDDGDAAGSRGVLGFLSAIELLLHPANPLPGAATGSSSGGVMGWLAALFGITPGNSSRFVCLRLGSERLIPVQVQSVRISEEAFDGALRPVRASLRLVLDTLSESESDRHPYTRSIYRSYMRGKALLAASALQSE